MGPRRGAIGPLLLLGLVASLVVVSRTGAAGTPRASAGPAAAVRVDSVGFSADEIKRAYLMTDRAVSGESFTIVDAHGSPALSGDVGSQSRGRWSSSYPAVYPLQFNALHKAGTYTIQVNGPVTATSPRFRVESARSLNLAIVRNGVAFFQTQRDGSHQVAGPLHRRPSHLHDAHGAVYRLPHFAHPPAATSSAAACIGSGIRPSTPRADGSTPATSSSSRTLRRTPM